MYRLIGTRYTRRVFAGAALAAVIGFSVVSGLSLAGAQTRHNDAVTLRTVSAATLAANGITLTSPSTTNPPVTAQQADEVAAASLGGSNTVLEHALANLTDTGVPGMTNRLVWVDSIMPPGGIWSMGGLTGHRQQEAYMVVFVDANTDDFLYATSGGAVASSSSSTTTSRSARGVPDASRSGSTSRISHRGCVSSRMANCQRRHRVICARSGISLAASQPFAGQG
jgi:hypothetical protein